MSSREIRIHPLTFLLVGAVSGAISAKQIETFYLWGVDAGPGLAFALLVGAALVIDGAGRTPRLLLWVVFVVAAWVLAARVAFEVIAREQFRSMTLAGALAGFVGGLVIAAGDAALCSRLRGRRQFALVVAFGAAAGTLLGRSGPARSGEWTLFVVWQGLVAGAIGWGLRRPVVRDAAR